MKISISGCVPYGPVGHPKARFFTEYMHYGEEKARHAIYRHLERRSIQGDIPEIFFTENQSMTEQGYYLMYVKDSEVADSAMEKLMPAKIFTVPASDEPGRKLKDFSAHLKPFIKETMLCKSQFEVWQTGVLLCDHDMGLETMTIKIKTPAGEVVDTGTPEAYDVDGAYYYSFRCTRCGGEYALPEGTD